MKHKLPELPYALDQLEPVISNETFNYHYKKHHQAYVDNLNKMIEGTKYENLELETIILTADGGIFNNAAQVWNHSFYFNSFSPDGGGEPSGKLAEAIAAKWGSFEEFKSAFCTAATGLFGSGWVWLVRAKNGELEIMQTSNAANPMTEGHTPLLTFDVWEHAYYVDYRNDRPDYIKKLWKIINWKTVNDRY